MARRGSDHPQHLPADRSVRGYRRPRRLAFADRGRAEDQSAPDGDDRQSRSGAGRPPRLRAGRELADGALHPCQPGSAEPFQRRQFWRALCGGSLRGGAAGDDPPPRPLHAGHRSAAGLDLAIPRDRAGGRRGASRYQAARGRSCAGARPRRLHGEPGARHRLAGARFGLRAAKSDGVVYPSVRRAGGECAGLFWPDLASNAMQGRHLDYHWNGTRVDLYRDRSAGEVYRIV